MNPFSLFESKNIENIKLGLQVVKSLNLQKEFELYFKRPFIEYEDIFNNLILVISKDVNSAYVLSVILDNNLDLLANKNIIGIIIANYPEFIDYFDVYNLEHNITYQLLKIHPNLINKLNISKLDEHRIAYLIKQYPQLKPYFE